MKKISIATATALTLSAIVFIAAPAKAGPIVPPGHYCLAYDLGGSDCSFTSYAQCDATASAYAAECYGKTVFDDQRSRRW